MASSEAEDFSEKWYADLGQTLSQGDIVGIAPYGLVDAPLTICQPTNADPKGRANYAPLDQLTKRRGIEFIHAKGKVGLGLVVWPDCQIDKLKNQQRPEEDWFVGIAPIHPITNIPEDKRANVLALNRAQFFPLPPHAQVLNDFSYVDFRYIWSVRYSLLNDRLVALSEPARSALAFQLFWFLTEVRVVHSVPCPNCSHDVASAEFFKFKDDGEAEDAQETETADREQAHPTESEPSGDSDSEPKK